MIDNRRATERMEVGLEREQERERTRERKRERNSQRCYSMRLICMLISEQETNQVLQFCLSLSVYVSRSHIEHTPT